MLFIRFESLLLIPVWCTWFWMVMRNVMAGSTFLDCIRSDYTFIHISKDDGNDCKTLCLNQKKLFLDWNQKHHDQCQFTDACARLLTATLDPITTKCTCQMHFIIMRQKKPDQEHQALISGAIWEQGPCYPAVIAKRLGDDNKGSPWRAVSSAFDAEKQVHCRSQPNNVWCDANGIAFQGDNKLAYQMEAIDAW